MLSRMALIPGLYEQLMTAGLVSEVESTVGAVRRPLLPTEAADRLALHLSTCIRRFVGNDASDASLQMLMTHLNDLLHVLGDAPNALASPLQILSAVEKQEMDGTFTGSVGPKTSLLDTTLLTNASDKENLAAQLRSEIPSALRMDAIVAFIVSRGLAPLKAVLERHKAYGRPFRVLTTTFSGITECEALQELTEKYGAQVWVSYNKTPTRLHAKAWIFHREGENSTALIGSSNWTHTALTSGDEWNLRISGRRNPDVIRKLAATFDTYCAREDYKLFSKEQFIEEAGTSSVAVEYRLSPFEIVPKPYQTDLLNRIADARAGGCHRNLLVAATGTGKTVMAAIDYAGLRRTLKRARLLFVAHRAEILEKSLHTYRQCLMDHSFARLWVGDQKPGDAEHIFASIQSLHATALARIPPDFFDVVVIDEFHHAAAASYEALLLKLQPGELLGLTATPERGDGLSILHYFGNRITAELRIWDAINQGMLVPFNYFGIGDNIDLRGVKWSKSRGYDVTSVSNVYTAGEANARHVLVQLNRLELLKNMRALGFCVSVEHAHFMTRVFNAAGVASSAVHGQTSEEDRRGALADLRAARLACIFSVEIFNEGVDIPEVDTLILLRPTDSATLFLQQLGRGLRLCAHKEACVVLDFVALHRADFRLDRRFGALLHGNRREVCRQLEDSSPILPRGCSMDLDEKARSAVVTHIKQAIKNSSAGRVQDLRELVAQLGDVSLSDYVRLTGVDLDEIYPAGWSELRERAGIATKPPGPQEKVLRAAIARLLHANDRERLATWRRMLSTPGQGTTTERERRLLRMLIVATRPPKSLPNDTLETAFAWLRSHPQVCFEFQELFDALLDRAVPEHRALVEFPDMPLLLHAQYTRVEILAGCGLGQGARVPEWREGVRWIPEQRLDLLAFTIDKTKGQFSPTTQYRDYIISATHIHWESQGQTSSSSPVGLRYQGKDKPNTIFLFARQNTDTTASYFLGPAVYEKHESDRPMAITWRLTHALPAALLMRLGDAAAVA